MKTKLDDIKIRANSVTPDKIDDDWYYRLDDGAKQQIKDLMLELIGEDEEQFDTLPNGTRAPMVDKKVRNQFRWQLRQKVSEL